MSDIAVKIAETEEELNAAALFYMLDVNEVCGQEMGFIDFSHSKSIIVKHFKSGKDYFLALKDNDFVGYAVGNKESSNKYCIITVYVPPGNRNKGIGTKLEEEQINHAKKINCDVIYSYVQDTNEESLRVQQKLNFEFNLIANKNKEKCYEIKLNLKE